MWIEREIERYLMDVSGERPACILTGGRQTGKTSLLLRMFPDIRYVSLDVPSLAGEAEESGERFLERSTRRSSSTRCSTRRVFSASLKRILTQTATGGGASC